ncbi:hypothetical protein Flavo103_21220 [Flavobacterium collinsii]|uniref:toll/interleukin-1 receptor domain-containing protein n=1 Tax=Flavobacterium collinsii TaxID=1114861 RepID=UPI0022C10865|nr:toll/interleukin-1 receptor domain-containing protein [Flavobacterium collinsii]GIQ58986.1 hypothetical protein Flavo103_21220 [Flavobacterium collinsii]
MDYKYQLIVLGSTDKITNIIFDTLWQRIKDLGVARSKFIIIDALNFKREYTANCPAFCIYFGDLTNNHKNLDVIEKLINDGTLIIPFFYNELNFQSEIPEVLHNHNGFLYNSLDDIERIVSLILEGFALLRNSRKIFISYKRNESRSVAIQLFEEFEKKGFDVFLDTHSIRPGEPFQEELWNRMTDCDAIVLLNTENFLESKWCKEEIAEANCKLIGIVQLIWPNHKLERMAELCLPINLKDSDFIGGIYNDKVLSQLKKNIVNEITSKVESIRARNLASRQDNIITEFASASRNLNLNITLQPERYISQKLADGRDRIFIPTVGIPHSFSCNQSEDLIAEIKKHNVESIYLLYDHIRIRDKWLKHLDWLNKHLTVQTLKIKNVELWLSHN